MLRSVVGLGAVAALALGSQACAATVTYTFTSAPPPLVANAAVGPTSGTLSQDLTVTPFDVTLGVLAGVTIQAKASGNAFIQAPPLPIPPGVPSPPPNSALLTIIAASKLTSPLLATLGSTNAFPQAGGLSFSTSTNYGFDSTTVFNDAGALAAFLGGAPPLTLTDSVGYGASFTNVNLAAASFGFSTVFTTIVTYDYTPASIDPTPDGVPEPAQWSLMLLGFAGVGAALRRRPAAA